MADKRLEIDILANDRASRPIKNLQSTIIRFVGAVSASIAALRAITFPIEAATRFDRILRDVQKTTGFVNEDIKILSGELLNLSRTVDTSADDLGRIAAAAGQLGLGEAGGRAIITFTDSIARAATTLDLTATQAATSFAKIASIFNIPIEQTEKLTSTINELSNTTTASADQLLDVVRRVGTIAGDFEDVGALAAQAIQLGLSPETAGTSLVKIFSNFESRADEFAEAFGITVGDFLGKGAIERWQFYLNELNKLTEEEQAKLINRLSGSGRIFALVDKQVQDAANGFEIFNQAQDNARRAFEEGTSAIEEYGSISQSLEVQLGILKNVITAAATEIGLSIVPTLIDATKRLQEFLKTGQAQAFFDSLGQGLASLVDGLVSVVEFLGSIDPALFAAAFNIGGILLAIKIIGLFLGVLERVFLRFVAVRRSVAAGGASFGALASKILSSVPAVRLLVGALNRAGTAAVDTGQKVAASSTGINTATQAFAGYATAIDTAIVKNAQLSASAARASSRLAAQTGGAVSSTIIPQGRAGAGQAQAQVNSLRQEVALQEQSVRLAQQRQRAAQGTVDNLNGRIRVIRQIQTLDARNAANNREVDRQTISSFAAQRRAAIGVVEAQRQSITAAQAKLGPLNAQLATWRQVLATRTQINLLDRVAPGAGLARAAQASTRLGTSVAATSRLLPAFGAAARTAAGGVGLLIGGIRTIIGLLGGPLSVAILAIIVFWDDLVKGFKTLTGEIEDEDKRLTAVLEQEARRRQAIINRQLADFARFSEAVRSGLDLGAVTTDFTGEETFDQLNTAVGKTVRSLIQYQDVIEATETKQAELSKAQEDTILELGRVEEAVKQAGLEGQDITAGTQRIKELNEQYKDLEKQISDTNIQQAELEDGVKGLARTLASGTTIEILDVTRGLQALAEFRESIAVTQDRLKRLNELKIGENIDPDISDEDLDAVRAQLAGVIGPDLVDKDATLDDLQSISRAIRAGLTLEIEKATEAAKEYEKTVKTAVAALDPDERALFNQQELVKLTARQLGNLVAAQEAVEDTIPAELSRTRFLRENSDAILSQKFAYDRVNDSLEDTQERLEANRKTAEGIFDGTIREVQTVTRGVREFSRELDNLLDRRDRELELSQNIDTLGDNIEDRRARIAELEEAIANSSDAYANNQRRDELSSLRALNIVDERVRRDAQKNQAQLEANRNIAAIPGLLAEAQEAVAQGDIVTAQAIKNQLDENIDSAKGIITDLTGLTDDDGNFLFREDEIRSLESALTQAAGTYTNAIPELNRELQDATRAQEQQVTDAIRDLAASNREAIKDYEDLLTAFPEFVGNIDLARKAWEETNKPLIDAIDQFSQAVDRAQIAGTGLGEGFGLGLGDVTAQSGRVAETIGARDDDFTQLNDALIDGVDVQAWIDKIETPTAVGVNSGIEASVEDGIPTFTGGIAAATEAGLRQALEAIDVQQAGGFSALGGGSSAEEAEARAQALEEAASKVVLDQPIEATLTATPTAETLASVRDGLVGAQAAAAEDPVWQQTAVKWGDIAAKALVTTLSANPAGIIRAAAGAPEGFATGGSVNGPGTGTSDSILARLSDGEYVSDARTVGAFGTGFFDFLKKAARGRSGVAQSFSRGLPAFAAGGPVLGTGRGSMTTVNLTLPGAGTFPVVAEGDTVARMTTAIRRETLKRGKR